MIIEPTAWAFGLAGGLMIGLAAAMFLLVNGHIMGASGLIGGLVDGSGRANARERVAFLIGLAGVPAVLALVLGAPDTHITANMAVIAAGGLLVGVGTRLANGCTSGHGVCGISRFSVRGIVATVFYLLGGGVSVLVFRHMLGVI
ncbi:MAG: YeeE/YedE family protein [Alphaproteobacteria bacterium]|nr:MAG: YeeE/YedE family protein [Alphaproteobacteria bacterium]